jgi:hypothetical protein
VAVGARAAVEPIAELALHVEQLLPPFLQLLQDAAKARQQGIRFFDGEQPDGPFIRLH